MFDEINNVQPQRMALIGRSVRRQSLTVRCMPAMEGGARSALIVAAFVLSSGRINPSLSGEVTTGFDVAQVLLLLIYTVAAGLLLRQPRRAVSALVRAPALSLLMGLAAASIVWSSAPDVTAARALALAGAVCFAIYVATACTMEQILRLLAWSLLLVGVLSVATVLLWPTVGVDSEWHEGAWQGIYVQKNMLGRAMAICAVAWLLIGSGAILPIRLAVVLASIAVLILAGSATALAVVCAVGTMALALRSMQWRIGHALAAAAISLSLVASFVAPASVHAEALLNLVGRDDTLTGRTTLWPAVIDQIMVNPVLGFAYGAFWRGWDSAAGQVWRLVGWTPNDSHNGLLDLWLDLGIVGVLVFGATLGTNVRRAIAYAKAIRPAVGLWPLSFLFIMVLYNLSESSVLRPTNLLWLAYLTVSYSLAILDRPGDRASEEKLVGTTPLWRMVDIESAERPRPDR